MKADRWEQVERIYHAAEEREPGQRAAFLAEACAGDEELRREVESLLAHQPGAERLLETPAMEIAARAMAEDPVPSMIGRSLGAYCILSRLGAGGMGEVFQARDTKLDRLVALKILPADFAVDAERMTRFLREARAASALNHPHVATIYEIGEAAGLNFIAMEHIEGQTLAARIKDRPLALSEILEIGGQIAEALDEAHGKGITHRDIKPANVMLNQRGQVKVLDFGLAKVERPAGQTSSRETGGMAETASGVVLGTVPYMSPEQALGREVDSRTDLFSLGIVLYEMATGRSPFAGTNSTETLDRILHAEPPPLSRLTPELPAELERILRKCLEKDRERRYSSARDLLVDLRNLQRDSDPAFPSASKGGRASGRLKRHKVGIAFASVFLVAMSLLAILAPSWIRDRFQIARPALHPLKRLTLDPGFQIDPAWSPRGDFIAYSSDHGGNFDIWVQPVSGGDPVQVTHSPATDVMSDWSPDGSQIVFRSEREGGGLFVVPAFGGRERKISSFGVYPQWSPDGTRVLFRNGFAGTNYQKVYVVALDGQPPREVLTEFMADFDGYYRPFWHPDGQRISVLGEKKSGAGGLWVAPLAGGSAIKSEPSPEVEKRLQENHFSSIVDARWGPSGREMYFTSYSNSGNLVRLFGKVIVDPKSLQWIAGPEQLTTDTNGLDYMFSLSPDGKRLAYLLVNETLRIWSFPFDSLAGKVNGQGRPLISNGMNPAVFTLSRDGKKLAFWANRLGIQKKELWQKSIEEGVETLLASGALIFPICWARDGARIAYLGLRPISATPKRENMSILVQPSGGGDEQVITSGAEDFICDWTSDGNWILSTTDRGSPGKPSSICLYPLSAMPHAETQMRIVTSNSEYSLFQAHLSPDDRWICFVGGKVGELASIFVVSTSGGAWTRVTDAKAWSDKPRWAPDGKTLYFISKHDLFYDVWGIRFDPVNGKPVGRPFQITEFDRFGQMISPNLQEMELGISANRLVLPISELTGSIWMIENVDR